MRRAEGSLFSQKQRSVPQTKTPPTHGKAGGRRQEAEGGAFIVAGRGSPYTITWWLHYHLVAPGCLVIDGSSATIQLLRAPSSAPSLPTPPSAYRTSHHSMYFSSLLLLLFSFFYSAPFFSSLPTPLLCLPHVLPPLLFGYFFSPSPPASPIFLLFLSF